MVKKQPLKEFVNDFFSVIVAYDKKKTRRIYFNEIVRMIYQKGYEDGKKSTEKGQSGVKRE